MQQDIKSIFQSQGAEAAVAFILDHADPLERRDLIQAAHREIGKGDGHNGNLDGYVALIRFGIDELLRQALVEQDAEEAQKLKDKANMLCFNFSAALADCWENDPHPRQERHHREGLLAAERCLAWRREFQKPPRSFSIAWWAKGAHQLSLGRYEDAARSFAESSTTGAQAAALDNGKASIEPGGYFFFMLPEGYRGLALAQAGDPTGMPLFESVIAAFQPGLASDDEEAREDAEIGIAQLKTMHSRLSRAS